MVTKYSAVLGPAPTVSLVDYFGGKTAHDAVSATVEQQSEMTRWAIDEARKYRGR